MPHKRKSEDNNLKILCTNPHTHRITHTHMPKPNTLHTPLHTHTHAHKHTHTNTHTTRMHARTCCTPSICLRNTNSSAKERPCRPCMFPCVCAYMRVGLRLGIRVCIVRYAPQDIHEPFVQGSKDP